MRERGFDLLPIGEAEAWQIHKLPQLHRDPFDGILVAQAACHGLAIVTDDAWIVRYPVRPLQSGPIAGTGPGRGRSDPSVFHGR